MTSRERALAASRGGEVDRRPNMSWLAGDSTADVTVVSCSAVSASLSEDRVVLAEVPNPFGLALGRGIDLNSALKEDPTAGGQVLDTLVEEVRIQIREGLNSGADGIFYRLHGANPQHCTPMQYGGHYLERDRELLTEAQGTVMNVLFVSGPEEIYVDFVSDLPADIFAWDVHLSKVTATEVRSMRNGATASADPTSEFALLIGNERYLEKLEQANIG